MLSSIYHIKCVKEEEEIPYNNKDLKRLGGFVLSQISQVWSVGGEKS